MTKPLSEDFVEYFMPDGSSNLDLEIAIYKGIKALESSIKKKDEIIAERDKQMEEIMKLRKCRNCLYYRNTARASRSPCIICDDNLSNWQIKEVK